MPTPPFIQYKEAGSCIDNQRLSMKKFEDIDDEVICSLGWTNLKYLKDHEVKLSFGYRSNDLMKVGIREYYEFGIFSTCYVGKEMPNWLPYKTSGSSISFTMPIAPMHRRLQGLNIGFVQAFLGTREIGSFGIKISNITKNLTWIYFGSLSVVHKADENIVWLSHWMFGNNEFEDGDEVSVKIAEEAGFDGVMATECAISPVYNDEEKEIDPLASYKSWKYIIGGDLSAFQLTSGAYFLNQDRFAQYPHEFTQVFQHKTIQNLLGYIPRYKGADAKCK